MKVYKCGTEILTKIGNIRAITTACSIRFENTQYEVSYFLNGDRKEVWLNEKEFTVEVGGRQSIGFKK